MKKLLSFLLVICLLSSAASAYSSAVHNPGINSSAEDQARMLSELGLFRGRDDGLQSPMTREEAAVMVVRFLGAEEEALSGDFPHPFTDVSEWASPYVGWLYQQGFTKGVGGGKFGSGSVTMREYSTFLSRAVYGDESGIATEQEIAESEVGGVFLREAAVSLSVRALTAYYFRSSDSGKTTAQWLCERGVFSAEQLRDASLNVLPSTYDIAEGEDGLLYQVREVAGQAVAVCPLPEVLIVGDSRFTNPLYSDLPYLHAVRLGGDGRLHFYILDCLTLEILAEDSVRSENAVTGLTWLASADGKDYFVERCLTDDAYVCGDMLVWDGEALSRVFSAEGMWKGEPPYASDAQFLTAGDMVAGGSVGGVSLVFGFHDALCLVGEEPRIVPVPAGSELLGWDGRAVALQCVKEEETTIFAVDLESGAVCDSYTVLPDGEGEEYRRSVGSREYSSQGWYYGHAGLYRLSGGRLSRVAELPVLDICFRRSADGDQLVMLSHEPGVRMYSSGLPTGSRIYTLGTDGPELCLELLPEHGIVIDDIWSEDSAIYFESAQSVGMMRFNRFTYRVVEYESGAKIQTEAYSAGRPELMEQPAERYVLDEMERLFALGIGTEPVS